MIESLKSRVIPLLILVLACAFLGLHEEVFNGPSNVHFTRQTDSLSFAAQYHNQGFKFFEPAVFNLSAEEGKSACEFPLFYYLTALVYGVIGPKIYVLKLLHFITVLFGMVRMHRALTRWLKDDALAGLSVLFLLTSTVLAFYAANFLPDAPALGFALAGWAYWIESHNRPKRIHAAFLCFGISGLIKATYFIHPIAAVLVFMADALVLKKLDKRLIRKALIGFALASVAVAAWNLWMLGYNAEHHTSGFSTSPRPIWGEAPAYRAVVWEHMTGLWYAGYLAHSSHHLLWIMLALPLLLIRRIRMHMGIATALLLLGCLAYVLLFFEKFHHHDYYMLNLAPLAVLLLAQGLDLLNRRSSKKWQIAAVKLGCLAVVVAGMFYVREKLEIRYTKAPDEYSSMGFHLLELAADDALPSLDAQARVLVIGDDSENGSLLALNRLGWQVGRKETLEPNMLEEVKANGLTHILVDSERARSIKLLGAHVEQQWADEFMVLFSYRP